MLQLPSQPVRREVVSFIFSLGTLITLSVVAVWWLMGKNALYGFLFCSVLTILFAAIAYKRKNVFLPIYTFWNKTVLSYSMVLRWWVLHVCFYMIMFPLRILRNDLNIPGKRKNQKSMWSSKKTIDPKHYTGQFQGFYKRGSRDKWVSEYIGWAISTGNKWMIVLLPFMIILKIYEPEIEKEFPSNIYTLY